MVLFPKMALTPVSPMEIRPHRSPAESDMSEEVWTIQELTRAATEVLAKKGFEAARLESEVLLASTLGLERLDLYSQFDMPVSPESRQRFREVLKRRLAGEPVAYITGVRDFLDSTFSVNPHVLIPRPETEHLVEAAIGFLCAVGGSPSLLELGTGSGCVIGTVICGVDDSTGVGVDISEKAVEVAQENLFGLGVAKRVELRVGDLFEPVEAGETFDIILSNPPYITESERESLPKDVCDYEPPQALFSPEDALWYHRRIIERAGEYLSPQGAVMLELPGHGYDELENWCREQTEYRSFRLIRDYAGSERVFVVARNSIPSDVGGHLSAPVLDS